MDRKSSLKPIAVAHNASNSNVFFQMAYRQAAWLEKTVFAWDVSTEHVKWLHREPRANLKPTDSKYENKWCKDLFNEEMLVFIFGDAIELKKKLQSKFKTNLVTSIRENFPIDWVIDITWI